MQLCIKYDKVLTSNINDKQTYRNAILFTEVEEQSSEKAVYG